MKVNGVTGQSTGAYPVNGSEKNGQKDTVKNTQNNPVKQEGGSVDGSGLNLMQGSIEEKKKQAQKDALELIMNQFSADGKIEQSLDERRAVIAEKKEASAEAQQHIDELNQRQAAAKEDYGITDDSEEQKDLDAYLKVNEYMKSGGKAEEPNEEEWDRFLNMGEMTEY